MTDPLHNAVRYLLDAERRTPEQLAEQYPGTWTRDRAWAVVDAAEDALRTTELARQLRDSSGLCPGYEAAELTLAFPTSRHSRAFLRAFRELRGE